MRIEVTFCMACIEQVSFFFFFTKDGTITPTVELNALAMKRGEAAHYKAIEPQQPPYGPSARYHGHGPPPSMDFRGMYNQR